MGNYVHSNLTAGEEILYEANLHWMIFVSLKSILTLFVIPLLKYLNSEFAV